MRRWHDPLRLIVTVEAGAGSDTLTFDCGHKAIRNHQRHWGKRARCHGCRVWERRV